MSLRLSSNPSSIRGSVGTAMVVVVLLHDEDVKEGDLCCCCCYCSDENEELVLFLLLLLLLFLVLPLVDVNVNRNVNVNVYSSNYFHCLFLLLLWLGTETIVEVCH